MDAIFVMKTGDFEKTNGNSINRKGIYVGGVVRYII